MPRRLKKGYYVKGEFVALGSARDEELKTELKGGVETTRTERKERSDALQLAGAALLELPKTWLKKLDLPDNLREALSEYQRLTSFEARRRQMQFIGKLMRSLDDNQLAAVENAIENQSRGLSLHQDHLHAAELWRTRLLNDDAALQEWLTLSGEYVGDIQNLRAWIRQARKDSTHENAENTQEENSAENPMMAAPKGRAYRQLFQYIRQVLERIGAEKA